MPGFNICGSGKGPPGVVETARKHRWRFVALNKDFNNNGGLDLLIFAYKATRPRPEIDKITMHHGQDEAYFPGKNRWAPITITFYEVLKQSGNFSFEQDFASVSMTDAPAEAIYKWWGQAVINLQRSHIVTDDVKKKCELDLLDGVGRAVWGYKMHGCWPSNVDPADLDYADSGILDVTFTLVYDKCEEEGPRE